MNVHHHQLMACVNDALVWIFMYAESTSYSSSLARAAWDVQPLKWNKYIYI